MQSTPIPAAELSEVKRQNEGSLLSFVTEVRVAMEAGDALPADPRESVRPLDYGELVDKYVALTDGGLHSARAVILTHTNKRVQQFNQQIRAALGRDHRLLHMDDVLLVKRNQRWYDFELEIGFEGVSLRNGTFIQVMNVPQVDRAVEVNLKGEDEPVALEFWNARVKTLQADQPLELDVKILASRLRPNPSDKLEQALLVDLQRRLQTRYNLTPKSPGQEGYEEYQRRVARDPYFNALRVQYGYAVTVHNAQGGEWPAVIVDPSSNNAREWQHHPEYRREYARWVYTAVTRAKEERLVPEAGGLIGIKLDSQSEFYVERIAANLFQVLTVGSKSPSVQAFEEAFRQKVSQFVDDGTYSQDEIEAELRQAVHQFFDVPRIVHLEEQEDTEDDLVLLNARLNAFDFELEGWLDRDKLNALRQTVFIDRHLKRTFSLKGEVQNWVLWNAAHILSRCNNPNAWDTNKNGLVYGMVQSGKTASMQALTLLAFASGYDVVIVLTSVSVALRQQTQNRFDELFTMERPSGEAPSVLVSSPTRESDSPGRNVSSDEYFSSAKVVHGKRGSSSPTCQYLVVKKETRILPKLVSQVEGFVKKMNEHGVEPKFLILDDEADYGSLDTGIAKQSTTNERIEALRRATKQSDYVAYTATPQGCLAADVDAEIGFPRDFIWVLEPSVPIVDGTPQVGSYTGGQELLVDYVDVTTRRIPNWDWPFHSKSNETGYHGVVSTRTRSVANMGLTEAEDEFLEDVISGRRPVPESLVNSLLDYVISGATRWAEVLRNEGVTGGEWDSNLESELPRHALMIHRPGCVITSEKAKCWSRWRGM